MINLQLKDFQQQTVDFLLEKTTEQHKQQQQIIVKSPTGSGKTIILISYIENYLLNYPNTIFCWFTVGKGDLEEQSKEKMERFLLRSQPVILLMYSIKVLSVVQLILSTGKPLRKKAI